MQTHLSKGFQKNMLKAWDFTKNKLCHRYFDFTKNILPTNILENDTGQIMVGLWLKLQMGIVD